MGQGCFAYQLPEMQAYLHDGLQIQSDNKATSMFFSYSIKVRDRHCCRIFPPLRFCIKKETIYHQHASFHTVLLCFWLYMNNSRIVLAEIDNHENE